MKQEHIAESNYKMEVTTNTAIDTAMTESAVPSSLVDQDLEVFGDLNSRFADAFTERIETAITKGVDSLPLLDGDCYRGNSSQISSADEIDYKPPKQRLWDALRYRFVRNVDVLEAYCGHHLFTLRKNPPAQRKRIVSVMRDGVECLSPFKANDETKGTNGEEEATKYPTRSELPSEEERKDLVKELSRLQAELETAKQKRNALLASVESAKRAEHAVADVVATAEAHIPTLQEGTIRRIVSDKVEKGNTVGLLAEEAKSLVGKLDGIKRDRNKKMECDDEEFDFVQQDDPLFKASDRAGNKRHKRLSLEEAYRKDRRQFGLLTDSTNDNGSNGINLSALKSMAMASPTPRKPGN